MPNIEVLSVDDVKHLLREDSPPVSEHEVVWTSPLEVLFSQNVIYPKFTDGRNIDDAVKNVRAFTRERPTLPKESYEGLSELAVAKAKAAAATAASIAEEGLKQDNFDVVIVPPFPSIEVVWWSPKLRDGSGVPLTGEDGGELRAEQALFTVDNRRLYALQRAAIAHWPRRCITRVHVVADRVEVLKHLRKFRTRTNGMSINITEWHGIGRDNARDFNAMRVWDWRSAVPRAVETSSTGGGTEAETAMPTAAQTGSCGCWEYLDNDDVRRGPFSHAQMRQWWELDMFPRDLRIRPYDAAAVVGHKEWEVAEDGTGEDVFRPVEEVFSNAPAAFAPGWSPRVTDQEGEWRKCAQCRRKRWEGWSAHGEWYCSACWRRWRLHGDMGGPRRRHE
mmetsp:Transcript_295/g.822  ORF Transcript_295/g.822 Transcript_295/m.822 type:complete len:391 (+) Transcript_295:16-1188(+)